MSPNIDARKDQAHPNWACRTSGALSITYTSIFVQRSSVFADEEAALNLTSVWHYIIEDVMMKSPYNLEGWLFSHVSRLDMVYGQGLKQH